MAAPHLPDGPITGAAAGRPRAAERGLRPIGRSRPARRLPVLPYRAADGRLTPTAGARAMWAGRLRAAQAGAGGAGGRARPCAPRPCAARPCAARPAPGWPGGRRAAARLQRPWRSASSPASSGRPWPGGPAAWVARRRRGPGPSGLRPRGRTMPKGGLRSRARRDRPARAKGACRSGGAGAGGEERRGRLMGVARSPPHIMAHRRESRRLWFSNAVRPGLKATGLRSPGRDGTPDSYENPNTG
jgi:hypothetical protein